MTTMKRIVCLANSRKLHGRCIAGIELAGNEPLGWIRPVSDREHQEVSEYERQYEDGSDPQLLDVIDIPLRSHLPNDYQQENWLLDSERYWKKAGVFEWGRLKEMAETGGDLWRNGFSTYNGENDKISLEKATEETNSLKLIYVDRLHLSVFAPGADFGNTKRRVQAKFHLSGCRYALWVTDPRIERPYLAKPDGDYQFGECYLTISLGEPYKGDCYKLVAAVIQRQQ